MRTIALLACLSCVTPTTLSGQTVPAAPRIGLVLSGGGARGFAHVGVLRVLHEMRIPVHAIAGTSMGAVVGGLYALGTPYPELERMFRSEDWEALFRDDPPRRDLPMRRKRTDREIALDYELGVRLDGVRLPPALVTGSKLHNALWAYAYRPTPVEDFDDLPIPFRAVATDVRDGSMVVLDHGDLAAAIRSSMAVPAAFSPQEVEGRRLVDGGLVRNIPIDVARAMGVDVLIVSDVSTSLEEAPSGDDPLSLSLRLITVITWGSSRAQVASLGERDIDLRPGLKGVSATDFSQLETAMAAGEAVAREAAPRLAALSIDSASYEVLVQNRARMLPPVSRFSPSAIRVDSTATALSPAVIEKLLAVRPGDSITLGDLRDNLTSILGYGGFQAAEFRITDEPGQPDVLNIRPVDKTWGPVFLRAGLSLTDRKRGAGGWSLLGRLEWTRLTRRGGVAWAEAEIGTRHGLRTWAQLPLNASEGWFLTGAGGIGRREVVPEVLGLPFEAELTDRQATIGFGRRIGHWGEARVGVTAGQFGLEIPTEVDGETPRENFEERSVEAVLEGDILDRSYFPSSGHQFSVIYRRSGTALGGTAGFEQLQVDGLSALSFGHQTVTVSWLMSTGLGTEVPIHRAPPLGGFDRITGAPRESLWAGYAVLAKLGWGYRIGAPASDPREEGIRFGMSFEGGQAWMLPEEVDVSLDSTRFGASIWAGVATALGPMRVAWAKVKGERAGWVIQVGVPR